MMMPDVNVLVAVSDPSHPFYHKAKAWLDANSPVATCAITELGMVRVLIQLGAPIQQAENHLTSLMLNTWLSFAPNTRFNWQRSTNPFPARMSLPKLTHIF
jgi:predicted nucleic acid-binding protein